MPAPKATGRAEPIKAHFRLERDTKNKMRFEEVEEGTGTAVPKGKAVIEKLYISKAALKKRGNPEDCVVTIDFP